jgi:hypothetical protein
MDNIRVLLVNLRAVLGDLVETTFRNCADMSVSTIETEDLAGAIGADVDVVVCQADDATVEVMSRQLFRSCGRVKVLAIRDDGRRAMLWELRPQRSVLKDLSPGLLVETVRRTAS